MLEKLIKQKLVVIGNGMAGIRTVEALLERAPDLYDITVFGSEPYEHWLPRLDRTGIVWGKVAELPDLIADPQARAMGVFTTVEHPEIGTFETVAAPFTMSESEVAVRGPAPEVGQHTAEVLAEFGLDQDRITQLIDSGIIR